MGVEVVAIALCLQVIVAHILMQNLCLFGS